MKIRALVVDDEPLARAVIEQYAKKIPELELICSCEDALEALEKMKEEKIDLVFLDINMPGISGISFLKILKNPPEIIFTTAYADYAIEGYELNAIDYLKKPFSFERFLKAFNRAEEIIMLKNKAVSAPTGTGEFLFIKSNKKMIRVDLGDILFIEGLGDYIRIQLKEKKVISNLSMKKMMELLPGDSFMRIHKSYIIAVNKIESIEGNMVEINKIRLPVGSNYRTELAEYIAGKSAEN